MSEQPSTGLKRKSVVGLSFALGLVFGILAIVAIQKLSPKNEQSTKDVAQGEVERTFTHSTHNTPTGNTIDVGQVHEIFKRDSIAEKYSSLHAALSRASEQELKRWWTESKKVARDSHRKIVQQVILRNLTAKNPQEAFRYIDEVSIFQTEAALTTVFSEWATLHLEGAIEAASTMVSSQRKIALQVILETRDDLPESNLRSIAKQLDSEDAFLKWVSDTRVSNSIDTPEESWEILLSDQVDDVLQTDTLSKVAEAWREQIGFEVLSKIYHTGIDDYRIKFPLMESIAHTDPASALDYARSILDESERSYVSNSIVRAWAKTDPGAALVAVSTIEPSSLASDLEGHLAITWAHINPTEMIENVESISAEYRVPSLATAFSYIAREDPLGAIEKLSSVEHLVGNTSTLVESIVREWSLQEPETAIEWVLENFGREHSQRRALLESALPSLARHDPNKAFELAINQHSPEMGFGLDYFVMAEIVREGDIEVAKKLLPRVNDSYKYIVYGNVASEMVDEGQTDEALDLATNLEDSDQRYYYLRVFSSWARSNPKNLLESLESLSTSRVKSIAAMQLITRNHYNPVLSDNQLDRVRTFLNPEDKASLKRFEE